MDIVEKNMQQLGNLCDQYHVTRRFVFGSVVTSKFQNDSDIDFVVDFDNVQLADNVDNYFDFKSALENLFQRSVDLLEDKAIRNPFLRKSINETKRLANE